MLLSSLQIWSEKKTLFPHPLISQVLVLGTKRQIKMVRHCSEQVKINNSFRKRYLDIYSQCWFNPGWGTKVCTTRQQYDLKWFFWLKPLYKIKPYIKVEIRVLLTISLVLSQLNHCSSFSDSSWAVALSDLFNEFRMPTSNSALVYQKENALHHT